MQKAVSESTIFNSVIKCYEQHVGQRDRLGSTKPCSGRVFTNSSDLVVDVELAARRALKDTPHEFKVFKHVYLEGNTKFAEGLAKRLPTGIVTEMLKGIVQKVGTEFSSCGLWPVGRYRKPVDVR
jgi:hypothetical protein